MKSFILNLTSAGIKLLKMIQKYCRGFVVRVGAFKLSSLLEFESDYSYFHKMKSLPTNRGI